MSKSCHIWQTETSLVTWLNIVTIVARSVRLLPAHRREDIHATRQLHCQWWSGQCYAKHAENAASVNNTCLYNIICYLQRIFSRNPRLKYDVISTFKMAPVSHVECILGVMADHPGSVRCGLCDLSSVLNFFGRIKSSRVIAMYKDFGVLVWNCLFALLIGSFWGTFPPLWCHSSPWPQKDPQKDVVWAIQRKNQCNCSR